jgi:ribosomal protein S24E
MKLNITENTRNEVLGRSDITAEYEGMIPTKVELRKNLSAQINVPEEKIVVRQIKTEFGTQKAIIYAKAYDEEEKMKQIEEKYVITRNFGKAKEETKEAPVEAAPKAEETAAPAEEAPKEKVKEEAPKEEKKEEAKVEEKKEEAPKEEKSEEATEKKEVVEEKKEEVKKE